MGGHGILYPQKNCGECPLCPLPNFAHEATCSTQHSDEQVRNTIFNIHDTHGIIMLYQEKLMGHMGTFSMLFRVVQGLHLAIFSFLLFFSNRGQKMT